MRKKDKEEMKKYHGIDWMRAIACVGVMLMHMAVNNAYTMTGFIYERLIPSFADFVFLFMAISAFGMCCGYLENVLAGKVNWTVFYKKRYGKVLPFFLLLIIIDLVINFSLASLCEGIIETTLLHGFIPNTLSVIGVGWFLGTVFVFYLIFPFYCVLIEKKSRAWLAFVISIVLNYICLKHFELERNNFVCSLCFFLAGGLVYLYKDKLEEIKWYLYLPIIVVALGCYYGFGPNVITRLLVTVALLAFAISLNCGKIKGIAFISGISLEFYLSHMVIFRGIELFHLNTMWGNGWGQYLFTVTVVFVGTIVFAFCVQKIIKYIPIFYNLLKAK